MKLIISLLKIIPKKLADIIKPFMLNKERIKTGEKHPAIKMNLTNFLICAESCGTCPSFPGIKGESLYCAGGKSKVQIEENGCNCVTCSLYEKCSSYNTAYFCIYGQCSSDDEKSTAKNNLDLTNEYIQEFLIQDEEITDLENITEKVTEENPDDKQTDVKLNYVNEKEVQTKSNVSILQTSLNAGIPHVHVCGGRARCSTCRVIITGGLENSRPRNEEEERLAKIKGFTPEIRLACQTTVKDDVSLRRLVLDDRDISVAINEGRTNSGIVGKEIQVAIMFSDIRSFTPFAENALPYDIFHILNRYYENIGAYIDQNGGYIDKYMGDGIMAIFGLSEKSKYSPSLHAVNSALMILKSLDDFNDYLKKNFNHEFKIGIGIHTGNVLVGQLGYHKKKEYTVIGDAVNTASRIESLNKTTGTTILVCEETYKSVKDNFKWENKFVTKVKGKKMSVTVHEPVFLE